MSEHTISVLRIPQNQDFLAAVGKVAVCHAYLDHILRMMVKTVTSASLQEALDATARQGSRELRQRVRKLARKRFAEGEVLVKLDALLERSRRATDKRNEFLHGLWTEDPAGNVMFVDNGHVPDSGPSIPKLEALADEIAGIAKGLNTARLKGFLHDALAIDRTSKNAAPAKSAEEEEGNG